MKVVILAGGLGTRLAEETSVKPKPMVEVGGRPILWHIMKHYAHYDFKEFFVALGYLGHVIKEYFLNYYAMNTPFSLDLASGNVSFHKPPTEDWQIHLMDTGSQTMTGGRILRLKPYLKDETFMVTYGDGVSNVDLEQLLKFHRSHGKIATISAVRPPARFGGLTLDENSVTEFIEKPQIGDGWINGGFLVFEPEVFDLLSDDQDSLEVTALSNLAKMGQVEAFKHNSGSGFWQCMDTLRDKRLLEKLWASGEAPWKVWES